MVGLEILVEIKSEKRTEFLQTFDLMSREDSRASGCTHQAIFEKLGERESALLWIQRSLEAGYPLQLIEDYAGFSELLADPQFSGITATDTTRKTEGSASAEKGD